MLIIFINKVILLLKMYYLGLTIEKKIYNVKKNITKSYVSNLKNELLCCIFLLYLDKLCVKINKQKRQEEDKWQLQCLVQLAVFVVLL